MPFNRHDVAFATPWRANRLDVGARRNGSPGSKNGRTRIMSKTPATPQQGGTPAPSDQQQGSTTPPRQPGQTPPVIRDWASI